MNQIFPFKLIKGSENQICSEMAKKGSLKGLQSLRRVILPSGKMKWKISKF
jgi:hypothetical protein